VPGASSAFGHHGFSQSSATVAATALARWRVHRGRVRVRVADGWRREDTECM